MEQTWFDQLIGWFSPQIGFRRMQYRSALEALAAYDGARTGRRTDGWTTSSGDANADIGNDLSRLIQRSRDLIRNDPHGTRIASVVTNSAVGAGIVPQADTGDTDTDEIINEAFAGWSEECDAENQVDFWGLQQIAVRSIIESGAALARFRTRRASDNLRVPLQIQVLEVDHIDRSKEVNPSSGGKTRQGVEFDAIGRRQAYWLYDEHPGASGLFSSLRSGQSRRIPAGSVVHAYRKLRPGQIHGVPWISPVMLKMRELGDIDEAAIAKARVAACLALWVEQAEGPDTGLLSDQTRTEDATNQRIEKLRPGMVHYGRFGEKATPVPPPRDEGYGTFYEKQQEMIAAGTDMFYAQLTGDLASVNYSSFRAGDRDFRGAIEVFRWAFIIPMLLRPWWRRFIDQIQFQGLIPDRNYGVNWTPPAFHSVDPVKDAQADELRLASGTKHLFDAIAEQGEEPRAYLRKIAEIAELLDSLGLKFKWMEGMSNAAEAPEEGNDEDPNSAPDLQAGAAVVGRGKPNGRGSVL